MTTKTRSLGSLAAALVALTTLSPAALSARPVSVQPVKEASQAADATAAADLNVARSLSRAFNRAAGQVEPSVVHVTQIREVAFQRRLFGPVETQLAPVGAGSGVIVSADGYILTNNHVIEGATAVQVVLADGRKLDGRVIGTDPATDLGVVRVNAEGLRAAEWGDSDELYVGEWVLAMGSPFGQFDNTVTAGIVSAKNRKLSDPRDERFEDFIQTDAAINPGNSGGPLVNLEGKVVGINSQIATRGGGNVGIGFSIPAAIARPVMEMIVRNNGRVERGWIGVAMTDATPASGRRGVLLSRIVPGGPANLGGLQPSDLVVKYNGREVDSSNRLRNAIAFTQPGTAVQVDVVRSGELLTKTISVVDTAQGRSIIPGGKAFPGYGFTVETLPADRARRFRTNGVVVNYLSRFAPAAASQLQLEDVILKVNGNAVENAEEFDRVVSEARSPQLRLDVYRPATGQRGYIDVEAADRSKQAD